MNPTRIAKIERKKKTDNIKHQEHGATGTLINGW